MRHRHRSFHFAHGVASGDPLTDRFVVYPLTPVPRPSSLRSRLWRGRWRADAALSPRGASRREPRGSPRSRPRLLRERRRRRPQGGKHLSLRLRGERRAIAHRPHPHAPRRPRRPHLRFAVVSCAKHNAGFFNGYGRIADPRGPRLPLAPRRLHLRGRQQKPPVSQTPGADIGRDLPAVARVQDIGRLPAALRAVPPLIPISSVCTWSTRSSPPLTTTSSPTGRGLMAATEHRPERDGLVGRSPRRTHCRARWEWLPDRARPYPHDRDRVHRPRPPRGPRRSAAPRCAQLPAHGTRSRAPALARSSTVRMLGAGAARRGCHDELGVSTGPVAHRRVTDASMALAHVASRRLPESLHASPMRGPQVECTPSMTDLRRGSVGRLSGRTGVDPPPDRRHRKRHRPGW